MTLRHLTIILAALLVAACGERASEPVPSAVAPSATTVATQPLAAAPAKAPSQGASVVAPTPPSRAKRQPPKAKTPEVPFEGRRIALVHTANVIGELEPCG